MKTIFLIRHTTPHVEKGICYGHTDVPVAPSFAIEANIIAKKMDGFEPQALFSSPLGRCAHLTRHLFANHRPVFDERLKELNFGDWEMKRWDDIDQQQLDDWGRDFWSVAPPNGESFEELNRRVIPIMGCRGYLKQCLRHCRGMPFGRDACCVDEAAAHPAP
jgi:alpha-ribazole phosphatase